MADAGSGVLVNGDICYAGVTHRQVSICLKSLDGLQVEGVESLHYDGDTDTICLGLHVFILGK